MRLSLSRVLVMPRGQYFTPAIPLGASRTRVNSSPARFANQSTTLLFLPNLLTILLVNKLKRSRNVASWSAIPELNRGCGQRYAQEPRTVPLTGANIRIAAHSVLSLLKWEKFRLPPKTSRPWIRFRMRWNRSSQGWDSTPPRSLPAPQVLDRL